MTNIILILFGTAYTTIMILSMSRKANKVLNNQTNIMKFMFVFAYGILFPTCYILTTFGYNTNPVKEDILNYDVFYIAEYYLIVLIITVVFFETIKRGNTEDISYSDEYNDKKVYYNTAVIMLAIGVFSDFLYLRVYGSFANYMRYSGAIRSGVIRVYNPFSYLIVFRSFISFSSLIFLTQIKRNNKFHFDCLVLYVVSCILALRVLYSNRGRLGFVTYILTQILYITGLNDKEKYIDLKKLVKFSLVGIAAIIGLFLSGELLSRNISDSIVKQLNKEISFAYSNAINLMKYMSLEDLRLFADAFLFPVYLLPTSIWKNKLNITTASSDLTKIITGFRKGERGITGERPVDFLSLSYMQLGIFGVIFIPLIYGIYIKLLLRRIKSIENNKMRKMISIIVLVNIEFESLFYADPQHIVYRNFALIVFLIIEPILSKFKI